jgi:hypothetical protein
MAGMVEGLQGYVDNGCLITGHTNDMITYLTHKEIDFEKYDRCIDLSLNGIVYAYSWYLDMVTDDWDILVEDDYKSVMPLPKRKKFGIHYIYQPFFVQQLGVFSVVPVTVMFARNF